MLELKGIYKTFNAGTVNEKRAIDGLDLTLENGDFVTVIGGNGAGKSTTLNLIAGVYPVDAGLIRLNGFNLTNLPEHKRARFLGRVFQDPMMGTAATMGIEENLALAYRRGKSRGLGHGITNEERALYHEKLATLGLGLEDRMTSKVGLLSGGLAFFAEWGLYNEMARVVGDVIPYFQVAAFDSVRMLVLGIYLGAGVLFGIGGSVTSIRKFMNV